MAEIRNRNSVQVNKAGKQKLIEGKAAKRNYEGKLWTYLDIAEASGVGEKTVKRFFAGQSVDCDNAIAIAKSLNLELAELIDPKEWNPPDATPETTIDWRDIFHKMLEEQLRRYQFRRQATGTGLGHEVGIYVPLGLVKPTTQPRRGEESYPSPDEGSSQYQLSEKEIEKRFEAKAFLRQVIEAGEDKTIAIIGEPGAGKSTWLEQIARHLKDSENVSRLPICIHLGSLDGKTLEDYLLQVWLKEALSLQGMVVSAQMQTELMQLFNSHQVCLLLDGVDEIRADTSTGANSPLQGIANQLRGWVAQAQTLLTCRLNVWQANDRVVPNCDVYRTLDFDNPQVGEFIGEWFARAGKPQLGKQLREKLGESGRERIRDLIRNPLRLALLCQTWAVKQGELPKTKATLYQRFREDFYEWKPHPLLTEDLDKQNELDQALGKLALEAIEKKLPLRKRFAYKVMGKSLFKLACDVGWLNEVYKDAETDEDVYAFYHLTFQEYFAALAIDDWRFFLTHDNDNPQPLPGNVYRIFEPQWKEMILLWLGREDVEKEQKEAFIQALVEFQDGCAEVFRRHRHSGFYEFRAYFLASSGVAEFQDCIKVDEIVAQIVKWGFGYFNIEKQEWQTYLREIAAGARASLLQTNYDIAVNKLIDLLETTENDDTRRSAAETLGKIDAGNEQAIANLVSILEATNKETRRSAAKSLEQIGTGNKQAITALVRILETTYEDNSIHISSFDILEKIGTGSEQAIAALVKIVETNEITNIRWRAADTLGQIGTGNEQAIAALARIVETAEDDYTRWNTASSLGQLDPGNEQAIAALVKILETTEDDLNRCFVAASLGEIGTGNEQAITALVRILESTEDKHISMIAAESLGKLDPSNGQAIAALIRILESTEDNFTRRGAADSLGKIGTGNQQAIAALVRILEPTENDFIRWRAAYSLGKIGTGNEQAIAALVRILETTEDGDTRSIAASSLGEIVTGDRGVIAALIRILETTENKDTCGRAADSLGKIVTNDQMPSVVSALQHCLTDEIYETNFDRFDKCYEVIWQCAQTLPYPTFYQAWHHPPITPPPEVAETTEVGFTPFTQCHNLTVFPGLLHTAINNDPHLREKVQLIYIDGSKFENPDNPASEIYAEMVMQGCPERQNGEPETMQAFKVYCQLKCQDVFLIFHEDTSGETPQGFSPTFLSSLSKFNNARRICVVSEQPCNLQTFSPTQPNLVADIVSWIREKMMED